VKRRPQGGLEAVPASWTMEAEEDDALSQLCFRMSWEIFCAVWVYGPVWADRGRQGRREALTPGRGAAGAALIQ
jgi:hypothetical protein